MRWSRDPINPPDWVMYLGLIVLAPAWIPAAAIIAALVSVIWLKRRVLGPQPEWSIWFAWYPVRVSFDETAWLEMVERKSTFILGDIYYRAIKEPA